MTFWKEVFERDEGRCRYCDEDLLATFSVWFSACLDHVVARCVGGCTAADNLVLACVSCNSMLTTPAAHALRTVESRRAFVQRHRETRQADYAAWVRDLRPVSGDCREPALASPEQAAHDGDVVPTE